MRGDESALCDDLLWGAAAIARELFGKATEEKKRKVYHLHETGLLPTWRHQGPDGKKGPLLARRSALQRAFAGPSENQSAPAE